jgi:hypothetical protein
METFIAAVIIIGACFAGIGIRIWIKGEFPETDIGRNKNMQKLGITCIKDELTGKNSGCNGCSLSASCSKK